MINIQENVPLAKYTTFKIGGPAKFFVEAKTAEDIVEAITFAQEKKIEFFILGGGSNVLVSDQGFQGLVIKINSELLMIHNTAIGCGSGILLSKIVREAESRALTGLEWAVGIPGTIGGAIRGNAGAFGGEMADVVMTVNYIDINDPYEMLGDKKIAKIQTFKKEECNFSYRDSIFKHNKNLIILSASLNLSKGDGVEIKNKMQEILEKRKGKQPQGSSAGSFFMNPKIEDHNLIADFERDVNTKSRDNKIPAGWLIDAVGLRGKKMGGAMVSEEHANFIVNFDNAKAEDVIMLASFIKQQVRDKMKVELHEEGQYIGF